MREVFRGRALEAKVFGGDWMLETQYGSVQSLAPEPSKRHLGRLVETDGLGLEPGAIDQIAEKRMTDRGDVDPDLMGAAGL